MVLVTILISLELIGHLSYRMYKGYFLFENGKAQNILFQEHPFLVGVPKKNFQIENKTGDIRISTNKIGNRVSYAGHMQHSEDALLVLCLGGSSTFATGVTDQDSWPYLLQQKLGPGFKVINMGVPGYTSLEALIQLSTSGIALKPDFIISYQGWNDIKNYHSKVEQGMYLEHGFSQASNLKVVRKRQFSDYSFIYFLTKKIRSRIWPNTPNLESLPLTDPKVDKAYVRNLQTLHALSNFIGAKLIMVPQVLNLKWFEKHPSEINLWTPTISNRDMPQLINRFNQLMSEAVPNQPNVVTLDSILYQKAWDSHHFVDQGHFSKEGGDVFSDILVEAIRQLQLQPYDSLPEHAAKIVE